MDKNYSEKSESDILLSEGLKYRAGLLRLHIRPLKLGTIILANRHAIKIKESLNSDYNSIMKSMNENIIPMVDFLSVCTLGSRARIFLFRKLLSRWLRWHLPPGHIPGLIMYIMQMYQLENFITSTRLISQLTVTAPMQPDRVEKKANGLPRA